MRLSAAMAVVLLGCSPARVPPSDSRSAQQAENDRANEAARQATIDRHAREREEKARQDAANVEAVDAALADDALSVEAWAKLDVNACAVDAKDEACWAIDDFIKAYPTSSKIPDAKAALAQATSVRDKTRDAETGARLERLKVKNKEREKARKADEEKWNAELKKK